jgi:hypothetical protein
MKEAKLWWESLPFETKWFKIVKNKQHIKDYPIVLIDQLTDNEIETIYKNENKQNTQRPQDSD